MSDTDTQILRDASGSIREFAARYRVALVGTLICLFYVAIVMNIAGYGFWRDDDVKYLPHYYYKLTHEGRWGNALFFPLLRQIPGWVSWTLCFSGFFWFCYFVCRRVFPDRSFALAGAAILMSSPALYAQMNWPGTNVPAALVLASSTWLVTRVRVAILVPWLSIVLFGMNQWLIYLLPLLYLDRRFPSLRAAVAWWSRFVLIWGAGFVTGYICADLLVLALNGTGIEVPPHLEPDPAGDAVKLIGNLTENLILSAVHISNLMPAAPLLAIGAIAAALYWWPHASQGRRRTVLIFLAVGLMIAFCHYVIVAPWGIRIDYRTLFPLHAGLTLAFLSLSFLHGRMLVLTAAAALIGLPAWHATVNSTLWFSRVSSEMRADVKRYMPSAHGREIIIDATRFRSYYRELTERLPKNDRPFFPGLDLPYRWAAALFEEGYDRVLLCPVYLDRPVSRRCERALSLPEWSECDTQAARVCAVDLQESNRFLLRLGSAEKSG